MTGRERVVILGGYGTFGSLVADQLTAVAQVVIAGRSRAPGQAFADRIGAEFALCDAGDRRSLVQTLSGARLCINASGPFRAADYSIPAACIDEGVHYLDLADSREYVAGIRALDERARQRHCFACVGASTTPAVTSALVRDLTLDAAPIQGIYTVMTAGNQNNPGVSTLASILSYVGQSVAVWQDGGWQALEGWGRPEWIDFPAPVGARRVQLVNVPDLALFPELFHAETVIFKAGVELALFDYALSAFSFLKRRIPGLDLPAWAPMLVRISRLFGRLGSQSGCLTTRVVRADGSVRSCTILAAHDGPRIPTAPAVILAAKILREGPPCEGAHACTGFFSLSELEQQLTPFEIRVLHD